MKLVAVIAFALLAGCSTVVPTPAPTPNMPSWDGGALNSGIIAVQPSGEFLVTAHLRARYNGLIAVYGNRFIPALQEDAGCVSVDGATWRMTPEAMSNFATMCQWKRMGRTQ